MAIVRDTKAFRNYIKNYWEYYRELEDEFLQTRKYVDFKKGNFGTYSVEFLKLFQAVCSEIDVLGKVMAKEVNEAFSPEDKQNSIMKWWFEIQDTYTIQDGLTDPQFSLNSYVCILLDDLSFAPWANYRTEQYINKRDALRYRLVGTSQVPKWWSDYNKVKHNRTSLVTADAKDINYTKANLGNLCLAFAALYVLERGYMFAIGTPEDLKTFLNESKVVVKASFSTTY